MFSSKVFKRYLLLFVGVALLACTLAGFTLLQLSSREMERSSQAELEKRWSTAVNDYAAQIKRLNDLALRISFEYACGPHVVRQGAIQELNLLELLGKFDETSLWDESIILYYPEDDTLFTSSAKYRSHYFSTYLMNVQDPTGLMEQIETAQWGDWIGMGNRSALLVFPLRFKATGESIICLYYVQLSRIAEQTAFVSALESGVTPTGSSAPANALTVSENRAFTLWVDEGDSFLNARQSLVGLSVVMIALISVVIIAVAVLMAYLCYSPIRRMTARFLSGETLDGNELESLSSTLNQAIKDKNYSQRLLVEQIHRMDEQKDSFRRQLLMLLLKGQAGLTTGDMLLDAGIHLPGPFYTLMSVEQSEPMPFAEMKKLAGELSSESIRFFAVEADSGVVVLCSLQEKGMLLDAADMLTAAGEASGRRFTVQAGRVCTSLEQLPGVLSALQAGDSMLSDDQGTPRWYDDGSLNLIFAAIRQGKVESARGQMHILIRSLSERHMPDALRRCAYVDIFNRLIQCALDARLPVPGELGAQAIEASDEAETLRLFDQVIDKMTYTVPVEPEPENTAAAFVRYVDEHACEISFNINCLSDIFGLSTKYIARQIREYTGMPYRNYIIHLRIKEACRLLRSTDTPVCDVHERVGYSSASHFVKVFRTVTGMTPSAYRSDGYLLTPDTMQLDALDDIES